MKRRIDVNLEDLDHVLDEARQAPLSDADYDKLKNALHALAALVVRPRNNEKTNAVLPQPQSAPEAQTDTTASSTPQRAPFWYACVTMARVSHSLSMMMGMALTWRLRTQVTAVALD